MQRTNWLVTTKDAYGSSRADLVKREYKSRRGVTHAGASYRTSRRGLIMVARNRIHCSVVAVSVGVNARQAHGALARDVLPWADPYVAQLIRKLQDEVRHERRMMHSLTRHYRPMPLEIAPSTSGRISAVK
jgi:hypothetical protein